MLCCYDDRVIFRVSGRLGRAEGLWRCRAVQATTEARRVAAHTPTLRHIRINYEKITKSYNHTPIRHQSGHL